MIITLVIIARSSMVMIIFMRIIFMIIILIMMVMMIMIMMIIHPAVSSLGSLNGQHRRTSEGHRPLNKVKGG